MADYSAIYDSISKQIELSGSTNSSHLVYLLPAVPVINDQSFQVYEGQAIGTVIGYVISTDPNNITYSILSGNTSNRFALNATTGILTTNAVLDYHAQPTGYTLTVQVSNNLVPSLTDTALISIEVLELFTICASNMPSFSATTLNNLIGFMTVGLVQVSSGTLGDYLIEWHLNSTTGTTVFISGNSGNTDTNIQSFHPIIYEPVQAGILYPVLRYIQINSVKYSAYSFSNYGLYSPDLLTCLNHVDVISISCSNGTTGTTYGHTIIYTNSTMPSSQANRSISYALNTDGSSKEIAYQFYGFTIADRISTYYCLTGGSQTLIDDWVVGTDCTGTTYTSLPKLYDSDNLKTSLTLTGFTYTSGDYLLFNIYPSYNTPSNTDTNWYFLIKCFTTSRRLSSEWCDLTVQQIDTGATMTFTYDSTNCQYVLTYNTASGYYPENLNSDIWNYLNTNLYYATTNWKATGNTVNLNAYTGASFNYINYNSDYTNYPLDGQLNITVSGTTTVHWIKYTFTDQNDYYIYKNTYTGMTAQSHWTDYTADVNDIKHYKLHVSTYKISLTSGDTYSTQSIYLCRDAVFNFDDVGKVITVDTAPLIISYTGVTCDKSATDIANYQTLINLTYSGWTWQNSFDTIWGTRNNFDYLYYFNYDYTATTSDGYAYISIPDGTVGSGFNLSQPGWFITNSQYYFYKEHTRVTITNPADPLNNYNVYTLLDPVTGYYTGTPILIKSVP
jgi:hypothetical protein